MTILEERGLFWWSDEALAEHELAPSSNVGGLLKIRANGSITLELDRYLPGKHGPMSAIVDRGAIHERSIQGLLKGSGKRVLLLGLIKNGGRFSSNSISYEGFIATHCLLADGKPIRKDALRFNQIDVPLEGFEEWLRLNAIKISHNKRSVTAKYRRQKDSVYSVEGGKLAIKFDIMNTSPDGMFSGEMTLRESATLTLQFKNPSDIEAIQKQCQLVEDLFIILTGSDRTLDWPWVAIDKETRYRLYYQKFDSRTAVPSPKHYECWTNFIQLREELGHIWTNWKARREEFGPGFYLYLGTRRGMKLFAEHRFVNLIWGIEAFHRKKYPAPATNPLANKIERILSQVKSSKDKRWLSKRIKEEGEPSLSDRIFETFKALPLNLEPSRLRAFANACASARNDISHFGGQRHANQTYSDFITDLQNRSEALSTLYHTLLLHEIGVSEKILKRCVFDGFGSFQIKYFFAQAGLLDKSDIDKKALKQ